MYTCQPPSDVLDDPNHHFGACQSVCMRVYLRLFQNFRTQSARLSTSACFPRARTQAHVYTYQSTRHYFFFSLSRIVRTRARALSFLLLSILGNHLIFISSPPRKYIHHGKVLRLPTCILTYIGRRAHAAAAAFLSVAAAACRSSSRIKPTRDFVHFLSLLLSCCCYSLSRSLSLVKTASVAARGSQRAR